MGIEVLLRRDCTHSPFREKLCDLMSIKGNALLLSSGYISLSLFNNYNLDDFFNSMKNGFSDVGSFTLSILGGMFKENIAEEIRFVSFTRILRQLCVSDLDLNSKKYVVDLYVPSNKKWHAKIAIKWKEEVINGSIETRIYSAIIGSSNLTSACFSKYKSSSIITNGYINHECDVFLWDRYKLSNPSKIEDNFLFDIKDIEGSVARDLADFLSNYEIETDSFEILNQVKDINNLRDYIINLIEMNYPVNPLYQWDDNASIASEILDSAECYLNILYSCDYARRNKGRSCVVKVKLKEKEIKSIMEDTFSYIKGMYDSRLIIKSDETGIYQNPLVSSIARELGVELDKGHYCELSKLVRMIGSIETMFLIIKVGYSNGNYTVENCIDDYSCLLKKLGVDVIQLKDEIKKLNFNNIINEDKRKKLFCKSKF